MLTAGPVPAVPRRRHAPRALGAALLLLAGAWSAWRPRAGPAAFTPSGGKGTKPGITVEKMSKAEADKKYGISSWGTWGCGVSKFDWVYSGTETAYLLEGEVTVTPTGEWASADPVEIEAGDLATFPDGMTCVWDVRKPIKKHYNFS
mmetsp:Transcript_81680/g.264649  ORF Transcript_81680/g.264649 Transcript_81680/m.264649 type:complete len:147 (+) Transcript_81680:118-558(+)